MDFSKIKKWIGKMNFILDAYKEEESFTYTEKELLLDYCKKIQEQIRNLEISDSEPTVPSSSPTINIPAASEVKNNTAEQKPDESQYIEKEQEAGRKADRSKDQSKYADLFMSKKMSDLSEKLESSPIPDIKKSMGLNERILILNELFRGQSARFEEIISKLNKCSHFDEAKQYLIENVVDEFDWNNEERIKRAQNFIKLLRRRYS